ncbi:hypothetical protein AAFN60_11770 [Roseibacillus persicicus]|uniref:hypothetical protein n=1 Tax=Roseibacillus persicicus TaxID=454148 RepID=UPI00398B0BAB
MKSTLFRLLLAGFFSSGAVFGQSILPEIPAVSPTEVSITFAAPANTSASSFTLESSDSLLTEEWDIESNATFVELGGPSYRVTVPRPAEPNTDRRFYRILLGDQILVSFEGTEFLEGTNGGFPISFSSPFSGNLPYSILASDGTTTEGSLNLSNASTAVIPFQVAEDGAIEGSRFVTLSLDPAVGESVTQSYEIKDNDAIWDGVFTDEDGAELSFCIEELRSGSIKLLSLVNTDDSNFFPAGKGGLFITSTFDENDIEVTLVSNTRLGDESPFGFPSYYSLTLDGVVRPESGGLLYEGANLGDATITHLVGRVNPVVGPPADAYDRDGQNNDSLGAAVPLGSLPGVLNQNGLSIAGDPDFFSFDAPSGLDVTVRIEFFHSDGDLDMKTYNGSDTLLNTSQGTINFEEYTFQSTGGTHKVEIYGFENAENPYRLTISTETLPPPTTGEHLTTTIEGRFAIIKRPLPPQDGKASLLPASN